MNFDTAKNLVLCACAGAVVGLVTWPWGLGLLDLFCFLVNGYQYSSIPWSSWRGLGLVMWPLVWSFIFLFLLGASIT